MTGCFPGLETCPGMTFLVYPDRRLIVCFQARLFSSFAWRSILEPGNQARSILRSPRCLDFSQVDIDKRTNGRVTGGGW